MSRVIVRGICSILLIIILLFAVSCRDKPVQHLPNFAEHTEGDIYITFTIGSENKTESSSADSHKYRLEILYTGKESLIEISHSSNPYSIQLLDEQGDTVITYGTIDILCYTTLRPNETCVFEGYILKEDTQLPSGTYTVRVDVNFSVDSPYSEQISHTFELPLTVSKKQ